MLRLAFLLVLAASPALAGAPAPLAADEAAVVGGWSSGQARYVTRVALFPIAESGGCLRIVPDGKIVTLEDHVTADKGPLWKVHRLKPGRYALGAVYWDARVSGYLTTSWYGYAIQRGRLFTFDVAAGQVTNIGVWPVTSPYAQHYETGAPDLAAAADRAKTLAEGVGPLVAAQVTQAEVVWAKDPCPAKAGG